MKLCSTSNPHRVPPFGGGDSAKTVPSSANPPREVVPYSAPLAPNANPANGAAPSDPLKSCRTVSVHPVCPVLESIPDHILF